MKKTLFFAVVLIASISCSTKLTHEVKKQTDSNGFEYETVTNDPSNLRIYTLENGLKVYLSPNDLEPRVQTIITVRAGGINDPADNTGLAHYFEHLMFKGTDKIGTKNFKEEKVYLDQITELFEQHKKSTNAEEKKNIYEKIDSISQLAAQYSIAGEYDKMISGLGAKGTNAFTAKEMTSYINNIPSNELDKWLTIEFERFRNPVLRLFHTELETVYEEYNMGQDNDGRKAHEKMSNMLFPDHLYSRNVIGEPKHLKNPSIKNIYGFFNNYYVPNNMAVILSGDFNAESMIVKINDTFGKLKAKKVKKPEIADLEPINEVVKDSVFGPNAEFVGFSFRLGDVNSKEVMFAQIVNEILSNRMAGTLQLNLVQNQKVMNAYSYVNTMKKYSTHFFSGYPKKGQTLDEVKDLILGEINKIKAGDFDDETLKGIIRNLKIEKVKKYEQNWRAYFMMYAFIYEKQWLDEINDIEKFENITKDDIINFVKNTYNDNYVVVYKKQGVDENKTVVQKPKITPVNLNRDSKSAFFEEIEKINPPRLKPDFISFKEDLNIQHFDNGCELDVMKNERNDLFELYLTFDFGEIHSKKLAVAIDLLDKFGTSKYSPQEFRQELFKHGLQLRKYSDLQNSQLIFSGLQESFGKALELAHHLLTEIQPDSKIYAEHIKDIMKRRQDAKTNQWNIMFGALSNYAKYGPDNIQTSILSQEELESLSPEVFTDLIHELKSYQKGIFYYGPGTKQEVKQLIQKHFPMPAQLNETPPTIVNITEKEYEKPQVFFVHFDMLQNLLVMQSKAEKFDPGKLHLNSMFDVYFGSGLTSILFQEIREKQGLAYMAHSRIVNPFRGDMSNYIQAILSTQPDKMKEALSTFNNVMNEMPKSEVQFKGSKESYLKGVEAKRLKTGRPVFYKYMWYNAMGIKENKQKEIYENVQNMTLDDLERFFNEYIKGRKYNYLVVGDKNNMDTTLLASYGDVNILELSDIFGY